MFLVPPYLAPLSVPFSLLPQQDTLVTVFPGGPLSLARRPHERVRGRRGPATATLLDILPRGFLQCLHAGKREREERAVRGEGRGVRGEG